MTFSAQQLVVKISVSNMLRAQAFYEKILGFHNRP
jgi:catechol 2,3-dioxygenase-like lactoylglutathione lyase family enzyme